jgi:hypothetical protein
MSIAGRVAPQKVSVVGHARVYALADFANTIGKDGLGTIVEVHTLA